MKKIKELKAKKQKNLNNSNQIIRSSGFSLQHTNHSHTPITLLNDSQK